MALSRKCSQINFPLQLYLTQSHRHNSTHTKLQFFKTSSLDDQFLLVWDSIDVNKDNNDAKMKKFDSKIYKLIAFFDHMLHHNQISSPDNDVEDDGRLEIKKSKSETKPSKSGPSSFINPT